MGLIRWALTLVHLFIVVLLLATSLNAYIGPKTLGYLNLLSLAFPILLIVHLALTLVWILLWKKRALVFLISSLFFLLPTQRIVNYSSASEQLGDIKVLTFNTKNGTHSKDDSQSGVKDYIESQNADVILLQEDHTKFDFLTKVADGGTQLLTKHKILHHEILITDGSNSHAFYADIEINGTVVRVVNIYLQPFQLQKSMIRPTGDASVDQQKAKRLVYRLIPTFKAHQSQVSQIRSTIDNSPYPVIIGGDFNSVPNSWEYFHLVEGLKDPFLKVGHGSATSFHDYKFPIRIDYLFHSEPLKALSYKVDRTVKLSDHFPVIATFNFSTN